MEETAGSVCVPSHTNLTTQTSTCGQDNISKNAKMVWRGVVKKVDKGRR